VFNNGTLKASKGCIPIGGQIEPKLISGPNALWKNAQKNEKKKHTSDNINNNIPYLKPRCTTNV
jgi:hypothetical protein